jgi:hypothetical protein
MTTYIGFLPQTTAPFQFQPTLDGQPYQASVTWNTYGQRWYLNIYALSGPLVVSEALVGSTDIVPATLTTTAGSYMATVSSPIGLMQSQAVNSVNVADGTTIAILAGNIVRLSQQATVTGADPNATFSCDINLVWAFFETSTLVFRTSSQQFEISP